MIEKIIIAGAGGQGVMLLGKILAQAAMKENKYVTWLPSYGAEVRGGTAHCMVIISDREIGSPYIVTADTLIIMNEPSWERFKARRKDNGLALANGSLISQKFNGKTAIFKYPFTDIAVKLGNIKIANMVALGCYLASKKIVNLKNVLQVIEEIAPADKKSLVQINQQALSAGADLVRKND